MRSPRSRCSRSRSSSTLPGRSPIPYLIATLILTAPVPSVAGVAMTSVRDNTLFFDAAGAISDGAGPVFFAGRNSLGNTRRGLVRFDVASALPPGTVVIAAYVRLTVSNAPNDTSRVMTLHRVTRDWGEGASNSTGGTGDVAQPGDATWLHTFHSDRFWSNPGGDFVAAASASTPVAGEGSYVWSGPGTVADVQAWLDDPAHNFGWLVRGDEARNATARRFESRESDIASSRPVLIVEVLSAVAVPAAPGVAAWIGPAVPNPARSTARFAYHVPADGHATLVVVDARGRRIATLIDADVPAGPYSATWDVCTASGTRAEPGLYFIRYTHDGRRVATQRVVVTR